MARGNVDPFDKTSWASKLDTRLAGVGGVSISTSNPSNTEDAWIDKSTRTLKYYNPETKKWELSKL